MAPAGRKVPAGTAPPTHGGANHAPGFNPFFGVPQMATRYPHQQLIACAKELFAKAGLEPSIAQVVAEILVDADLLGYDTHGLLFVPAYLAALEAGRTAASGEPEVVKDHGHALLLDGRRLPGQWATVWALERARERIGQQGLVAVAMRGAQNISCLATYVKRAADEGLLALLMASAPASAAVAPHGGREGRYSTNPMAVGIPTDGHPILIDTSSSATSNRLVDRHRRAGSRLPQRALVTAAGAAGDDPGSLFDDPAGAILPGGGLEYGHKGFALGLMVEAFTSGLLGWGRAELAAGSGGGAGNSLFLLLIDPDAFGGRQAMRRETGFLAAACRQTPPIAGGPPVRVPGDRAIALYERQLAEGVALHPEIMPLLEPLLGKYGVPVPQPLG
jgi:LDH2 family malate/lactate/ureidoglycolate dehydrogenase